MEVTPATRSQVWRRIVPLFFTLYAISVLDRANVGFAALRMNQDLGLSPAVYGFGAGVFFIGYVLVEIPSNLILHRVGPRIWLSRIMITWGFITAAMALTTGPVSFYILRFLLGVAEAGFAPGMLYCLTLWFPRRQQARVVAQVWTASALAIVIGGPLSAGVLQMDGLLGLAGWKWIFVIEGVPAVIGGIVCLTFLTEKPQDAAWLAPEQRRALSEEITREQAQGMIDDPVGGLLGARVWLLSALYFFIGIGFYGITFWLPQILKQMSGLTPAGVSLVAAIPFTLAAIAMNFNASHSDRTGERRLHLAVPLVVGAVGLACSGMIGNVGLSFMFFCTAVVGIWSAVGVFWSVPAAFLRGKGAAGGLALINAIGSIGAFVGPYAVGLMRTWTPDFAVALLAMSGAVLVAAMLALSLKRGEARGRAPAAFAPDGPHPIEVP